MPEAASLDARDPRSLGGYEIVRRIGFGAQGVVYLARAAGAKGAGAASRDVAIKVLHGEWARDPRLRDRFAQEAEAARRVDAFCTARILDACTDGDAPYIVSEYVPGRSLRAAVTADGPYERDRLYRLAVGTATALAAIHRAGIVHRDFKPDNVLLGPDGPRVIDFGVAKAGDLGDGGSYMTIGTPSYMAPEQAIGDPVGPAADLFAWAEVIAFAATGRPPFGDDSAMAVAARLISQEPDLDGVHPALRGIVASCLARDPAARPSASEVLLRLLGHEPPDATPRTGPRAIPPSVLGEGARTAAGDPGRDAGREQGGRGHGGRGRARWRTRVLAGAGAVAAVAVITATVYTLGSDGGQDDHRGGPAVAPSRNAPAPAGAWRGVLSGAGSTLWLLAVKVAGDGRTARLESPSSHCRVSLRRTGPNRYAAAGAVPSACPWTGARLSTRPGAGAAGSRASAARPDAALRLTTHLRTGRTVTADLSRPTATVPRAFTGHWTGRIRPAALVVELTLGGGAHPGVWRSHGYPCTGSLRVWAAGAHRLILTSTPHGACTGGPRTILLTRHRHRLNYRQLTGTGATAQRGLLRHPN